ncbi:uncharacterized protein [Musca autumnalis]|uniref:uncharacterized protein n=1 Tax=Musca autumnalis TaxID=221902 RepID=UPI003CF2DF35
MIWKLLITLSILTFAAKTVYGSRNRRFNVIMYSIYCNHTDTVLRLECHLTKLATDRYVASVKFMHNRNMAQNSVAHAVIYVRTPRTSKVVKFFDFKINVCDALSMSTYPIPLAKDLFDEARRTSNLPYNCPIKGNYLYYMNNYTVTSELLPAYAPIMNFSFILNIYEDDKLIIASETQGGTIPKA